jgi:predicted ATPase
MKFPGHESVHPPPSEDWSALKDAVRRFESAWQQGLRPVIEDYLPVGDGLRSRLLPELVHLDLEMRLKGGEPARVEEYLARYPELTADRAALGLIAAEFTLRRRGEPHLDGEEYLRRFPNFHRELAEHLAGSTVIGSRADRPTPRRPPNPADEAVPEVAGYEVLGLLGRGGMGVVYQAQQQSLQRLVALKFLPAECARDPVWLERFQREGRTASALNHPHICTIYDTGACAGRPFLSMELIDGQTLEALAGQGRPVAQWAGLVGQAARALAAAHAAGVVHRDIKPANLMVRHDGIVKVLDFGLAHRLPAGARGGASEGPPTDPGTRVGTLLYMSPEQARADPVDTTSDVFSLGIVLYELVTGQHPFLAESEVGVLHAITAHAPVPASRLNPEVPAPLETLIQQMLAKDPRLRPTAAEVDAALTELTGKPARRPAGPPAGPGKHPSVGRQQERAALHVGFESAAAGRGLVLCVTGEPGLGKTTLVEDFLDDLAAGGRPHAVARGRSSERLAGAEAYLPVLEALDGLLRGEDGEPAASMLRILAPTWFVQLRPARGDASPAGGSPEGASQERLKRELGAFLDEVCRLRPLVLFLDDVHWADASTVDLLAYLGVRCAARRLLVVLAYRPSNLALSKHPFGPVQLELQARGICREVRLGFLAPSDVKRYLILKFPGHKFPVRLAAIVHEHTEGNPLFVVDLLQYLCDRGVILAEAGCWTLVRAMPELRHELPRSIRSLIRRQLAQLDEADGRLLTAASVQGNEFDAAVVARALERDADDVENRLTELERVHAFVRALREHELPDRTLTIRYTFVHVLYQNALYASLQPTRRAGLSAAVARAILGFYGERNPAVSAGLALLFEVARDLPRAAAYFLHAAEHAVRVSANREAEVLARRGLALLGELPDTSDRARQELALLLALGVSLVATQGFASPEVEQIYVRARALCQQTEDVPALFPVLYGLWNVYLVRCDLSSCKDLATQMFALAGGQNDSVFRLVAHNVLQQPHFHMGHLADARRQQEQALELYDRHRHRTLTAVYGEDPGVGCLVYGAATLWHLGYPDQAVRSINAARSLADDLAHPFNVAQALYYGAFTHLCRREAGQVQELAGALMALCDEQGFALLLAGGLVLNGWSLADQGQTEEGIKQMRQGLAAWQATGALSHRPSHLALLAETLGREGRVEEGLAALAEALALASSTGERFWEAEFQRLRGELLLRRAKAEPHVQDEVKACFRASLRVARRQRAKSFELRTAVSWSRLNQPESWSAKAQSLLAETYGWFTEGLDTRDLREARALLDDTKTPRLFK